MSKKKQCVRCDRPIDPYARLCPYCNHDQSLPAPPPPTQQQEASAAPAWVPPDERNWRRHLTLIGGAIALLIASFVVGALINSDDAPKNAPKPVTEAVEEGPVSRPRRSDVTLVPVGEGSLEQPITSAPSGNAAEGVPTEYQRSDATAVSSTEYAQLAQRAEAERKAQQELVDPRSITGPAYAQGRPVPPQQRAPAAGPPLDQVPQPMTSAAGDRDSTEPLRRGARVTKFTRPVPQHQPLPNIRVSRDVTARLELTVGADGRVKHVRLKKAIPGHTPALIAAVQRWRFKPATENGVPVAAPFSVDISFNADD